MRYGWVVCIALALAACDDYNGPECNTVADCGDSTCADLVCDDGHCGVRPLAAGAMATIQTEGDCRIALCDGNGNVMQKADDSDLPPSTGACFTATCHDGVASNPPAQAGTSCGGGMFCDDVGQCVGCIAAFECPGSDTECHQRTCTNETCGVTNVSSGVKLVNGQVKGDCQVIECDGSGGTMKVEDDTDVPAAPNKCVTESCVAGVPTPANKPLGTACGTTANPQVCDGMGHCGQCNIASDCPGSDTDCHQRTCVNNTCGVSNTGAGVATSTQVAGDCHQIQCDGSGGTMTVVDDSDVPATVNCLAGTCSSGTPGTTAAADGTSCSDASIDTRCRTGTCVPAVSLVRVGDGSTTLGSTAAQVAVEERYVSDGALVTGTSVSLPTSDAGAGANAACTITGTANAEGYLARSVDEHFVVFACYDTGVGGATSSTASSTVNRIVARIDAAHAANTTTRFATQFSTNGVRSVASTDGNALWVGGAGTGGGVVYTTLGATDGTNVLTTATRCVEIQNGQLFGSTAAALYSIGSGLPTSSGQTATNLPGLSSVNPHNYAFFDLNPVVTGVDTAYVADDSSTNPGVQKWTFDGTSWTRTGNLGTTAVRGLTAYLNGTTPTILAVTTASPNAVIVYVDDGVTAARTLVTAASATAYRGVALSPH